MKVCPVWKQLIDCEKILEETKGTHSCHFYNTNSRQCVLFDISENLRDIPQAITMLSLGLGPKKPPRVLFTDIDDYLNEIEADKDDIYRGIVRATTKTQLNKIPYVISSYIVGDQLITFKHDSGKWSGIDAATKEADTIIKKIQSRCLELLLDARSGVLEFKGSQT